MKNKSSRKHRREKNRRFNSNRWRESSPLDQLTVRLGFGTYRDYIKSDHWKNFVLRYRASNRPQVCNECGKIEVQLHHVIYKRLGCELLDDVIPLCKLHHKLIHNRHIEESKKPTKKPRSKYWQNKGRVAQRNNGLPGQMLVQCSCGRRAFQDGPYCCLCGLLATVVRTNPAASVAKAV
jgi:hypothetical protein